MKIFCGTGIQLLFFCVIFGAVSPVSSVHAGNLPTLNQHEAQLFNTAHKEYKNKNYKKTIELLNKSVSADKKAHPFAYALYGLACSEVKQYKKSVAAYEKGIGYYPENYNLRHNYALALMHDEQYGPAASAFLNTLPYAPREQQQTMRFLAAQNYFYDKKYKYAVKTAEILLQAKQPEKKHIQLVAMSYMNMGAWERANSYFTLLARHYPLEPQVWNTLAGVRSRQQNQAGAAAALEISQRIDPKQARFQVNNSNLASLYAHMTAPHLEFIALTSLSENDKYKQQILNARIKTGNLRDAIKILERNIQEKPDSSFYFLLGTLEYRLLNREKAQKSFAKGANSPDEFGEKCAFLLALSCWEQGDLKKASELFTRLSHSSRYAGEARFSLKNLELMEKEALFK